MNRILAYSEDTGRRQKYIREARFRARNAAGYLGKLLAEYETASERKKQILTQDAEGLLREACQLLKKSRKAKPRSKRSP